MNADEMKKRTQAFALRVVKLVESLPKNSTAHVLGSQLLRCGTSVAANYRAACRARSKADFVSKMGVVEEEADESIFWIEMLVDVGLMKQTRVAELIDEGHQILSITVSSINTARGSKR